MTFIRHNIWVPVLCALIISLLLPALGTLASPFVPFFFMVMVFLSSLDIRLKTVLSEIHHPGKALATLCLVHLIAPLSMLPLKSFVSSELYLGLILAAAMPSGIAVVFLSKLYKGDPSRALVITTLSNFLSPVMVPVILMLFVRTAVAIDPFAIGVTIIKLVMIPAILAHFVQRTPWEDRIRQYASPLLILMLALIIIGVISPVRGYLLAKLGLSLALAGYIGGFIMLLFLAGFFMGSHIQAKISYGITASFKNFALAIVLAFSLFNVTVALPAIVYAVMNSLLLIPIQWYIQSQRIKKA